jgi:tRNA threonylcarbamoyl adenosine modification protein YeaZ
MKILALEFSSPQRSVAVADSRADAATPSVSEVVETGAQLDNALGMIETALREARCERGEIECLALGIGPGSYMGIRSAIALAQGWQLGAGKTKLLAISSAQCVAAQARAEGMAGRVAVVIDAQRNEFYLGVYELGGSGCREAEPLRLASREEVQAQESAGVLLIGPEVVNWFPGGRGVFPRAAMLAQLAAERTDFVPGEKIEPIYLRETRFVKAPPPRVLPF